MAQMSAMTFWSTQRGRIQVAVCLFFLWATYSLWNGGRESVTASQQTLNSSPDNSNHVNFNDDYNELPLSTLAPIATSTSPVMAQATTTAQATSAHSIIIMDEFDESPLRDLCANTSWVSSADVVVNCEGRVGGVGNVRQEFLVCVHHAIEIGAGLIRPTIMLRSESIIEYQNGPVHNMSYLFDLETFDARLRKACPQMPLYEDLKAVEELGSVSRVGRPWELPAEDGSKISFKDWADMNRQSIGAITVIDMPLIMSQTPVCNLNKAPFVMQFGRLIEFRPDIQLLTERALSNISARFKLPPTKRTGITEGSYVGVHLRTEVDAVNVGYTSYEEQAAAYIAYTNSTALRVIYAASGNQTSLDLFSVEASKLSPPAHVVTKWDLLDEHDAASLKNMTWDQQALVDYLMLEKSSLFAGVSDSSFSWGVAYTRQVFSEEGTCNSTRPEDLPDRVHFRDSLSAIFGRPNGFHLDKLWP